MQEFEEQWQRWSQDMINGLYQIRLVTVYSNGLLKAVALVKCIVFIRI